MLKFNNKMIPDFVRVRTVNVQALPKVNTNLKNIAGSFGVLDGKSTFGEKIISADISIIIPKGKTLQECVRIFAKWLKGDSFKLSPLVIMDDSNYMYMAKVNSSVSLSDLFVAGEGTLDFVVPSGVSLSVSKKEYTGTSKVAFNYGGTHTAFPIIELTLPSAITKGSFVVTNIKTGEKIVITGTFAKEDKIYIDCEKHLVKVNGVLHMEVIGLNTKFFGTVDGANEISCSLSGSGLKVIFQERYL